MTIDEYMRKHRLTQTEFAKLVGVIPPYVCIWRKGKCKPNLKHTLLIAKATNGEVLPQDFIGDKS